MKKTYLLLAALFMLLPSVLRAQTDMTDKIQNADLSSNEGWTITQTEGQAWATQKGTAPYQVSEAYAGWGALTLTEYGICQKIVLPKGAYELSGYAFYRYGEAYSTDPTISNAVLYAGEDEVAVATLGSIEGLGTYANSVDDASSQFSQGNYLNKLAFNVMEDDTEVEIGFKGTHDLMRSWFICGPLTLVQTSTEPQVANLEELQAAYNEALAAAQAVDGKMSAEAKAALDAAIAAEVDTESADALKEATKALTAATNAAKASISRYEGVVAYLAKMGAVLELTNVYTPESYATYVTDVKAAYDGEMTEAEAAAYTANSAYNSGWHATNFIDDVLLSNWTIGGEPAENYSKGLYINTWSVEGNSDGSNVTTPFFEYWTGDANSLGNTTLAAKVEGLTPGNYFVKVLARVRLKNNVTETPTGITMSVNGGEAVDLCAGTQSTAQGFAQMYYGTFTAEGVVGEDGILNIEIKVEDTNCSWIAYKNVKYMTADEKLEADLAEAYDRAMAAIKEGNYYQIYTLVGETPYYLTNTGTLTANAEEAYSFKMTTATQNGTKYAKGWNTSVPFTNPTLSSGSTGDIVNDGSIHRNNNNRNDFERQVFFEQDGKYAVRSTNGGGTNWGANTYWAQVGTDELPEAGYHLAPQYIWVLNDVTGEALLAEAKAIVEAKAGVGDGLFQISEESYATFAQAVEDAGHVIEDLTATAEAKDAAIADLRAAMDAYQTSGKNMPEPDQAYTFQQKASELYLGLTDGVKLASQENASELFFEAGENGGYFIHDAEGQYVGFEGTNNWTMSTSADKKYEWIVTNVGDNYYTLSKPSNANHHVGTNDNDVAEGAPCYADKNNSDNSYYLWNIAEVEEEIEYELVDLTQADYHSWTAPDATGEITGAGYCLYEVGNSAGNIYGNSNVLANEYADLTDCGGLVVVATAGQPRFLFNRPTNDSQDYINIPNNAEQTAKYMTTEDLGDGSVAYTINVPAIVADYGFCHLHAIKGANWNDATVTSIEVLREKAEIPEPETIEIAFERIEGKNYTADEVAYDEAAILAALGATSWDEITTMYPMVMTTGEAGEDHDGWRNVDGDPAEWSGEGTDLGLCLKYPHDGSFALCTHPGNDPVAGTEMSAAWILGTEAGRTVIVKVNVTFVEAPEVTYEISDLKVKTSIEYASTEASYTEKIATISDEDVAAILADLGLESLEAAEVAGYNPSTGKFVAEYAPFDGWRDANGDFHGWSGDTTIPACVKYTDGQEYYCYNIKDSDRGTIATYWAITNGTKAVLVEVDFIYTAEAIATIGSEDKSDGYKGDIGATLAVDNGQTAHYDFDNFTKGENNWQNWVLLVNEEGTEKVALRADNWENVAFNNEGCTSDYNWDTFKADMEGARVQMDVTYLDGVVTMTSTITTTAGTVYNYSYTKSGFTAQTLEMSLSEEAAHLVVYKAEVSGESVVVGINGIAAGINDGKAHKILRDGKIVIVKGEKEFNVNGAAVK